MTIDEFWEHYDHCNKCRSYSLQGNLCYGCKWRWASGQYAKETDFDGDYIIDLKEYYE